MQKKQTSWIEYNCKCNDGPAPFQGKANCSREQTRMWPEGVYNESQTNMTTNIWKRAQSVLTYKAIHWCNFTRTKPSNRPAVKTEYLNNHISCWIANCKIGNHKNWPYTYIHIQLSYEILRHTSYLRKTLVKLCTTFNLCTYAYMYIGYDWFTISSVCYYYHKTFTYWSTNMQ